MRIAARFGQGKPKDGYPTVRTLTQSALADTGERACLVPRAFAVAISMLVVSPYLPAGFALLTGVSAIVIASTTTARATTIYLGTRFVDRERTSA